MNKTVKELLTEYKNEGRGLVCIRLLAGNFGDRLIMLGADKLINEVGITRVPELKDITDNDIIFVIGAGGIGYPYLEIPYGIFKLQARYPNNIIILGPTSAMLSPELKNALSNPNLIIYAREPVTYEYLKELGLNIKELYLDHCTSLNLTREDIKIHYEGHTVSKALFHRQDEDVIIPDEIKTTDYDLITDPCSAKTLSDWIKLHANCDEIITNRVHSAIMGLIIGKKVTLYHNYYHKNHSMWEYSLQSKGINWVGKPWVLKQKLLTSKDKLNFRDEI